MNESHIANCAVCGAEITTEDNFDVLDDGRYVCMSCTFHIRHCSRCRRAVLDSEARVFSKNGPAEVICRECLSRMARGEEVPAPYWQHY